MKIQQMHLLHVMEYARIRGISGQKMVEVMRNPPEDLQDAYSLVVASDFYAVVELVRHQLQDELLGIRLGEFMNLKALGLVYQISLEATTVEEAFFYLKSFMNASFPLLHINTTVSEDTANIALHIENGHSDANRIILENTLTVMAREIRVMSGDQLSLCLYSPFYHASYPHGWQKGDSFSLEFTNSILKATLRDKSRWNLDVLVPEYLKLIESLRSDQSFSSQVKIMMLSMATPELPDLEGVADALNMTIRTLQRRLVDEATSFRQISAALKKEISYLFITHNRFSVADISHVLGFSEPASFIHSFKKWYGNTPEKFRKQLSL